MINFYCCFEIRMGTKLLTWKENLNEVIDFGGIAEAVQWKY